MGTYHIFVNPTKKEFFDPLYFGDNSRKYALFEGVHRFAIRLLLYSSDLTDFSINEEFTSWIGTPFFIVNDATTSNSTKNLDLYTLAKEKYRDISPFLFDYLLNNEQKCSDILFERAKVHNDLFLKIVACYYKTQDIKLGITLEKHFGNHWQKKYNKAAKN